MVASEGRDTRAEAGQQTDGDVAEAALASKAESQAVVTNEPSAKAGKSTDSAEQEVEHAAVKLAEGREEDDEEEEEECAFCRFMKGGGCKEQFVAWEECVAEAKETGDFVSKCAAITEALQLCMNTPENKDYYQLFLDDQEEYVQEHQDKEKQEGEEQEQQDKVKQEDDKQESPTDSKDQAER